MKTKPLKAIARARMNKDRHASSSYPIEYKKAAMYNDLKELLWYIDQLEEENKIIKNRNKKLERNLHLFAPGKQEQTIKTYIEEVKDAGNS